MTLYGIDLASHQGPNYAYPTNPDFAIIKASGGHGYKNEFLAQQVRAARARGIVVGFYHYMYEPSFGGGDVNVEVANFIAAVRPYVQPGTTLWLDVEEYPNTVVSRPAYIGDWIVAFCEAVQREYGCVCGIYCATWFLKPTGLTTDMRLRKYPFWMASWQSSPPPASAMAPWDHMTLWQYDATGIDKDRFEGTMEEFKTLGVPGAPPAARNEIRAGRLDDGRPYVQVVFDGYVQEGGVLGADVADLGIAVKSSTTGQILDQSVQQNEFKGWRVRE